MTVFPAESSWTVFYTAAQAGVHTLAFRAGSGDSARIRLGSSDVHDAENNSAFSIYLLAGDELKYKGDEFTVYMTRGADMFPVA